MFSHRAFVLSCLLLHVWCQGFNPTLPPDYLTPTEPYSPYSYPSPNATGLGGWEIANAKAKRFVSQLTLEEKVGLCTGTGLPP